MSTPDYHRQEAQQLRSDRKRLEEIEALLLRSSPAGRPWRSCAAVSPERPASAPLQSRQPMIPVNC